eukprot:CAMPEP_0184864380 /NCGR_PEP_ID=MMETSP0580-20130426/14715_1 /TAXON_ID=1118495 /ORGANISM="Dactyliosolen fragilissimus" /LENGTH=616 /DNA_ID=CAMNT_0027363133 /DNA_START=368 /DNA_END=2218 /DNA_ORIENTATION=+
MTPEEQIADRKLRRLKIRAKFARSKSGKWGPSHSSDDDSDLDSSNLAKKSLNFSESKGGSGGTDETAEETLSTFDSPKKSQTSPTITTENQGWSSSFGFNNNSASMSFDSIWNSASNLMNSLLGSEPCGRCQGKDDVHDDEEKTPMLNGQKSSSQTSSLQKSSPPPPLICSMSLKDISSPTQSTASRKSLRSNRNYASKQDGILVRAQSPMRKKKQANNISAVDDDESYNDNDARVAAKVVAAAASKQISTQAPQTPTHATQTLSPGGEDGFFQLKKSMSLSMSHAALTSASVMPQASQFLSVEASHDGAPKAQLKKDPDAQVIRKPISENVKEKIKDAAPVPFEMLSITKIEMEEFHRSISELTMRSCQGGATAKLSDSRRMAYYAVGKEDDSAPDVKIQGINKRCYFTGKAVEAGRPFYAGSVQQGLRTLIVFCLPSALGIPSVEDIKKTANTRLHKILANMNEEDAKFLETIHRKVDSNILLSLLPDAGDSVLNKMKSRYSQQYATLPIQLRSANCWKLYIRFCFFSGLPIADGETYYRVSDHVLSTLEDDIDEVTLSHEVMETVNGEQSAEILRLPNIKTFRYLRKHYAQQCAKLNDRVFDRKSWEMAMAEV